MTARARGRLTVRALGQKAAKFVLTQALASPPERESLQENTLGPLVSRAFTRCLIMSLGRRLANRSALGCLRKTSWGRLVQVLRSPERCPPVNHRAGSPGSGHQQKARDILAAPPFFNNLQECIAYPCTRGGAA